MACLQWGQPKSDQTTMVTGASAGPREGESATSTGLRSGPKRAAYTSRASLALAPSLIFSPRRRAAGVQAAQGRASSTHWRRETAWLGQGAYSSERVFQKSSRARPSRWIDSSPGSGFGSAPGGGAGGSGGASTGPGSRAGGGGSAGPEGDDGVRGSPLHPEMTRATRRAGARTRGAYPHDGTSGTTRSDHVVHLPTNRRRAPRSIFAPAVPSGILRGLLIANRP
jgi:hypothetical protein